MIAIAGGSGYVGRHLVEALSVRNDILILDRCAPDFPLGGNIRFVETDLAEEDPSEYMAGVSGLRKWSMSSPSSKRAVIIWSSSTKNVGVVTTMSFMCSATIWILFGTKLRNTYYCMEGFL